MPKKGSKKWRSIDTQQIEEQLEKETREQRQDVKVEKLPDEELFVVDTAQDDAAVSKSQLGRRRKGVKLLRYQTILSAAHRAKPVHPLTAAKKAKGQAVRRKRARRFKEEEKKDAAADQAHELDLWATDSAGKQRPTKRHRSQSPTLAAEIKVYKGLSSQAKAVEIDAPGCSYNPDSADHQEAVAEAVAAEMSKQYAEEMSPKPVKVLSLPDADELDALLVDPEPDEDAEEEKPQSPILPARQQPEKKTRTERNRAKRRRGAETAVAAKKLLKKQRQELDSLVMLQQRLQEEEAQAAARAARKAADKQEAALQPPRLGRTRFEPAPMQVLLSEEISGSLRQLKGTALLALERYKSLQKRGIIEPRVKASLRRQKRRKQIFFTPGETSEKLKAGHEETQRIITKGAQQRAALKKLPKS